MNYYSHHIGDYIKDTAHLSFVEDSAYRKLLDKYYADEKPIPNDLPALLRLVRARSKEEKEAVSIVLEEFFTSTDAGWTHKRCDAEIAIFQEKSAKAASAAHKRWGHSGNADDMRTHSERTAKAMPPQEPISNTHSPISNNHDPVLNTRESTAIADAPTQKPKASPVVKPETVEQQIWDDWLQLRKNKKAPVTKTVVQGAIIEAGKAGMPLNDFFAEWCTRGSQGLKAEWLRDKQGAMPSSSGEIGGLKLGPAGSKTLATMYERAARKAAEQNTFDL